MNIRVSTLYYRLIIAFTLFSGGVSSTYADIIPPVDITYTIPNSTLPRDAAVGTIIGNSGTNRGWRVEGTSCEITRTSTVSGSLVPGYTNVYATSNPGIGIRFQNTQNLLGGYVTAPRTETMTPSANATYPFYRRASLVVVGPVASGTLSSLPSMTHTYTGSCITTSTSVMTLDSSTIITGHTCSVTTPNVNVTLPSVSSPELTPSGSTAGTTTFSIGLDCTAGSDVHVTLTDVANPSNRTNQLALDPSSTAQGVKLQILRSGTPISLGADSAVAGNQNQFLVGSSNGLTSVDLSARYISTGVVVPGSVKAQATFTMSYQ